MRQRPTDHWFPPTLPPSEVVAVGSWVMEETWGVRAVAWVMVVAVVDCREDMGEVLAEEVTGKVGVAGGSNP